jgi:hypothetical protein
VILESTVLCSTIYRWHCFLVLGRNFCGIFGIYLCSTPYRSGQHCPQAFNRPSLIQSYSPLANQISEKYHFRRILLVRIAL